MHQAVGDKKPGGRHRDDSFKTSRCALLC